MSSNENGATDAVLPITGYLDRISARPGERIAVKVSAQGAGSYQASVIRIRCADPNPAGPGLRYEDQEFGLAASYPARSQPIDIGSYGVVPSSTLFSALRLAVAVRVQPWLLRDRRSVLVAGLDPEGRGWSLSATTQGLTLEHRGADGTTASLSLPVRLKRRQWYRVWAGFDVVAGKLVLGCRSLQGTLGNAPVVDVDRIEIANAKLGQLPSDLTLTFAGRVGADGLSRDHFNGRLEDPALYERLPDDGSAPAEPDAHPAPGLCAWWDFSQCIEGLTIIDRGPDGLHGRLINAPTRAVCGSRWNGTNMAWRHAPRDYAAIHFHEDDLYDCRWETDFEFEIPGDARSGVYGLRLQQNGHQDIIPFYVLPPKGKRTAKVCYLAPTFTYQAYANHARGNCDDDMRRRMAEWGATPYNPDDYPIYGRSTYNMHPDGTGTSLSSRLRPTLTIRPAYLTFVDARGSGLRHFSADSHLTDWLEEKGIDFDVVTDEDLDDEGVSVIEGYEVVLTGSHPEYHTKGTLDALETYTANGGRLVYLGGNGFYWRIARSQAVPGTIEVRRAETGIRAWAAEPGESYNALDGQYGGLWRRNGRPPQRLVGIGFSAQGLFEGSYYRILPDARRPEVAWMFEGVTEEKLGDYGLSGGGAAGFELDRADTELGTPEGALILARSENHSDSFVMVPEEFLSHLATTAGEAHHALIRGEIVYFKRPDQGGEVLSVGSICFCGSLSHNNYQNGISRFLENVVRRFGKLD